MYLMCYPLSKDGCKTQLSLVNIIGVGSPIGSDSVGWSAIDGLDQLGLQQKYPQHQVTLKKLDRPGPALLQQMEGAELAIIIDALVCDREPGEVVPLRADEIAQEEWVLSGHELGVAETIALGGVLGELPERLLILGIAIKHPDELAANSCELSADTMGEVKGVVCGELG